MNQRLSHAVGAFSHLSGLDLADTGGKADIDALVGSDLYWRLVTGRVVHGENGPAAIETVFGWELSGTVDSTPELTTLATTHTLRIESYPFSHGDDHLETQVAQVLGPGDPWH